MHPPPPDSARDATLDDSRDNADDDVCRPLRGQRVVVVGGTSGMGLGAVHAATRAGAHAALFLMTNPYVTGTVLEVSGGETLVSIDV